MNCENARDLLLEADLTELRGEGGGALVQHLHHCSTCQSQARRILDQTAALAAGLERVTPPTPAHGLTRLRRPVPGARTRRWAIAVPLALAAGLAVLLLGRRQADHPPASGVAIPDHMAPAPASLDVRMPPGQTFTVFQTDNPGIVVVWSF